MGDDVPECVHGRCKDFVLVIYQTEGAFQLIGAGDKDPDLPAADIALQKAHGNYGQALIIQDGIAEGVRTGGFPGSADTEAVAFDEPVG